MSAVGGVPRRLTYHPGADVVVGWTPDGKRVLFRSVRVNEYLLSVNGRDVQATSDVSSFFQGTAGKQVLIRVGPDQSRSEHGRYRLARSNRSSNRR
jgi:hypothetical protein